MPGNGGRTPTHALLAGSPAIDMGDGINDARIDMGAFELALPALFGDNNEDNGVNAADYVVWRKMLGSYPTPYRGPNDDGDDTIDEDDYDVWAENFDDTLPGSGGSEPAVGQGMADNLHSLALSGWAPGREGASASRRDAATVGESLRDSHGRAKFDAGQRVAVRDSAFVAWLAARRTERLPLPAFVDYERLEAEPDTNAREAIDDIDAAFELLSTSAFDSLVGHYFLVASDDL